MKLNQMRSVPATWLTPGRVKIEQHNFSFEVRNVRLLSVGRSPPSEDGHIGVGVCAGCRRLLSAPPARIDRCQRKRAHRDQCKLNSLRHPMVAAWAPQEVRSDSRAG